METSKLVASNQTFKSFDDPLLGLVISYIKVFYIN